MKIVILLGDYNKYLGYKIFTTDKDVDSFIDKIHPLMMANIHGVLPLKKRLEIVKDDYFPQAGAVSDFVVIDTEET